MEYSLNGQIQSIINSLNLLSIERTRTTNQRYDSDSTIFADESDNLFQEKPWKDLLEPIPHGPQAISMDFAFPGYSYVYGIPERINSFIVKNTVEYKDNEGKWEREKDEEPIRLCTCDHFNDKYPNHS